MRIYIFILLLLSGSTAWAQDKQDSILYQSEYLTLKQLSSGTILHISYMDVPGFGHVACNGLVFTDAAEALIVDSPANVKASAELLDYLKQAGLQPEGWVATHFHEDCIAGLTVFQDADIPLYALDQTISFLKTLPDNLHTFKNQSSIPLGHAQVVLSYLGAGHTRDNIVAYFAKDQVLFGGCLIKEQGANKGNLEDADETAWPETVKKVQSSFSHARWVVPGHGKPGGPELLDYTISLFDKR